MLAGMRIRAVAITRANSSALTAGWSAKGVPATRTKLLIGTLSGCGSWLASCSSRPKRSSTLSPMPMIPPEQTVTPLRRTRSNVFSLSW